MSDLQRSFVKAKLADLPFDPPMPQGLAEEEAEQDDLRPLPESHDDDSSSASSASSTGTIKPSPSKHLFARPKGFVGSPPRNALNTQSYLCPIKFLQISIFWWNNISCSLVQFMRATF